MEFQQDVLKIKTYLPEKDFLDKHCDNMLESLQCLEDHDKICPNFMRFDESGFMNLQKLKSFVRDICDEDSDIGKAYRDSVQCVNGIEMKIQNFTAEFKQDKFWFMMFLEEVKPDYEQLPFICLIGKQVVAPLHQLLEENCGKEPGKVVQPISERVLDVCPSGEEMEEYDLLYTRYTQYEALEELLDRK